MCWHPRLPSFANTAKDGPPASDPTIATLSSDDPPIITAVAAGKVTITAGTASADLTVFPDSLPTGTIIWSNPGDGSGVKQIVPAVPSPTGVADVFALQADCNVQAITRDGVVSWTNNIGVNAYGTCKSGLADFQGGLIAIDPGRWYYDNNHHQVVVGASVQKLDGITGQAYPAFSSSDPIDSRVVAHTDGTIFALVNYTFDPYAIDTFTKSFVIGVDPITGQQKFSVPLTHSTDARYAYSLDCTLPTYDSAPVIGASLIVAGDGNAYLYYVYNNFTDTQVCGSPETYHSETHARMLRVGSDGSSSEVAVGDWTVDTYPGGSTQHGGIPLPIEAANIITNADQGVLLSLGNRSNVHLITISGASVTSNVTLPSQIQFMQPAMQAQDGTFFGVVWYDWDPNDLFLASFDKSGNIKWTAPNYYAQIATADGGVIAGSYDANGNFTGQSFTFDANGNSTGQVGSLPIQSWGGYAYEYGSVKQVAFSQTALASAFNFWPWGGSTTATKQQWFPPLDRCTGAPGCVGPHDAIYNALSDLIKRLQDPTIGALAQTKIFNPLGNDANNNQLTTASFIRYLNSSAKPRFYNGLLSTYCINSSICNYPPLRWLSSLVKDDFQASSTMDAETQTPSYPLLTFVRPAVILYNHVGENRGNEALIFHEALHGITGQQDRGTLAQPNGILEKLGLSSSDPSCAIDDVIWSDVLSYSNGLDTTTTSCP